MFVLAALCALRLPHTWLVARNFIVKMVLLTINLDILGFKDGESVLLIVEHWSLALLSAARDYAPTH